jgi:hypothetical protein
LPLLAPCSAAAEKEAFMPEEQVQVVRFVEVPKEPFPVCIKVCEPICAQSDYTVGVTIFDRPVASITLQGLTRIFNCTDREFVK